MMPGGSQTKMQVIRLRTDDNQRIVGKLSFRFEERINSGLQIRECTGKLLFLFLNQTYVVGTQKNRLNETVLLSTQNRCLN